MMMMTTTTTLSKAYEWMLVGTENIHELAAAVEVCSNALITFFSSSRSMVPSPFLSNSWKAFVSSSCSSSKLFRFLAIISQNSENSSFPLSFAVTETRNNDHSVNKKSLWVRNKKNYASPEFSKGVPVQLIIIFFLILLRFTDIKRFSKFNIIIDLSATRKAFVRANNLSIIIIINRVGHKILIIAPILQR